MNEKIVVEQINFTQSEDLSDFPKINKLLKDGWLVKNWNVTTTVKPITIMVVAVLQKV